MNVGSVNSVKFGSKLSVTKEGNEYKKTHMGLKAGIILGGGGFLALGLGGNIMASGGNAKKGFKGFFATFKKLKPAIGAILTTAVVAGVLGGIGAIHDAIVNNKIRKNVDNAVAKVKLEK